MSESVATEGGTVKSAAEMSVRELIAEQIDLLRRRQYDHCDHPGEVALALMELVRQREALA